MVIFPFRKQIYRPTSVVRNTDKIINNTVQGTCLIQVTNFATPANLPIVDTVVNPPETNTVQFVFCSQTLKVIFTG
jgi:hypothetical protein